jgi:hypothetical protein
MAHLLREGLRNPAPCFEAASLQRKRQAEREDWRKLKGPVWLGGSVERPERKSGVLQINPTM